MLFCRILYLGCSQPKLLFSRVMCGHTSTCPATTTKPGVCPGAGGLKKQKPTGPGTPGGTGGPSGAGGSDMPPKCPAFPRLISGPSNPSTPRVVLKRALRSGKCRFGFIPEEWFLFFKPFTGVTGPYIFMIGLGNYLVSKEIYVMEHEYYSGLSIIVVLYLIITKFGKTIGKSLDKEVDEIARDIEKGRKDELARHLHTVQSANQAIWRAEGQVDLMNAKKENIAMQLEAAYRERLLMVFQGVRGRMDYHIKRHRILNRIHKRWMVQWILRNVNASITPEIKKQAMASAIKDLASLASAKPVKATPAQ